MLSLSLRDRSAAFSLLFSTVVTAVFTIGLARGQAQAPQADPTNPNPNTLTLFVSPSGNDAWSGQLAAPNPAGTDGPLATIEKARDRIREIKTTQSGLTKPVHVFLCGGTYPMGEPLVFTEADSGTEACPITYQAYPGEQPILSGGVLLPNTWEPDDSQQSKTKCDGKLWRLDLSKTSGNDQWKFNQLFVNDERRVRARIPNRGSFLRSAGPVSKNNNREFYFKNNDLMEWDNLRDTLVVVYHSWETSLHHIQKLDTETGCVTLVEPSPWPMGQWEKQHRYYVENVFEGLDEPGEWYFNRNTGTLYYYPMPGETMDQVKAIVPRVTSTLVRFDGKPSEDHYVEHLHFHGLAFRHTDANLKKIQNPGQGEIYQPALIMAVGLRNSSIVECEVAHAGAHAIWMANGCKDNRIQQCHIYDLNGGGVYIGGGWGIQDNSPTERITVDNCFIHDGGLLFHGAHGVWIGTSSYNQITHNEISNFDYTGISCGWSWGFQPTTAHHNNLDYNYIHHLSNGEGLSDMGGIYTLGISPGTTERNNHIHDVYNYAHVSHGSGIYPDEGSSEILIENNVVHHVDTCPLFQHYGKDNTIRNNIFAFGGKGQLQRCREDVPCHYVAEGNIVYADIPQMLGGTWQGDKWKLGRNIYWSTAGKPDFAGMDFDAWVTKTNEVGSIVADPLFVDPENGDFRLKPNSPAITLGFKPIDLGETGLYGDATWVNLPKQYPNRVRNEVPAPELQPFIINFGFEGENPGEEPVDGHVCPGENGASLAISADTAALGKQSLKFTDVPDQKRNWEPHLFYYKTCEQGPIELSWDMLNSKEKPALLSVELREYAEGNSYLVGPTVLVTPDGTITANGQNLGTIPLGEWVHVDMRLQLGDGVPKTYRLTLTVPGRDPTVVEIPYSGQFQKITWLGICSLSPQNSEFYIDNLKLGTEEELEKVPQRR